MMIPKLDKHGLRNFGLMFGAIIGGLFGVAIPWLISAAFPWWPWVITEAFFVTALISPAGLNPIYKAWMRFGFFMNGITTPIILGVVFYLVIMPMGLIMRLFNRDTMHRKFESTQSSYRVESDKIQKDSLERPF